HAHPAPATPRGLGYAPHRAPAPRALPRRGEELDRGQPQGRVLLLLRGLARAHQRVQGHLQHRPGAARDVRRLDRGGARPGALHPYLTDVPKILGLDGRKMSKSYGNAVELGEDPESARKRIMVAVTDPARKRRNDPGHPEVCPIYWLHRAYSPPQTVELVDREC